MNFFDNLVQIDLRKNIGIVGLTDEFFCVYLNDILKQSNKNILVVVNSLFEANNLYSSFWQKYLQVMNFEKNNLCFFMFNNLFFISGRKNYLYKL